MAARNWTPEQRRKQAEAIQSWRPWEQSTGPKTAEGKAKVSRNAYTGGHWRELREFSKAMNAALRGQREAL